MGSFRFLGLLFFLKMASSLISLPNYVTCKPIQSSDVPQVLREMATPVIFPLSEEDKLAIDTLGRKFDGEGVCAGLAAVQIGISKRIIIFATPDSPEMRIWRPDLIDVFPRTIWVNPSYVGNEEAGKHDDYEGCFSVEGLAGLVPRYREILYKATLVTGEEISGVVRGYAARLIQHEIDHLNGVLFSDIAYDLIPIEEYRQMRLDAIARGHR